MYLKNCEKKIALRSKQEYQNLLLELIEPLRKWFSPGCARIRLSGTGACYSRDVIEMESFARPLWGLVPFWAGGGRNKDWEEIYKKGLLSGTDPENLEYWGKCDDCDQRFVEMAPIAAGILLAPHILWDPFSEEEQKQICSWLIQINEHELPKCNWYYFRILVNLAMKKRKMPYSAQLLESDLAYMESCYLGDGWYVDGVSEQTDYYCSFAMEYYSQIYAAVSEKEDLERCKRLKERAMEFARDFQLWFDEEGAALPYGRSLIYRMAQTAFWPALLYFSPHPDRGLEKLQNQILEKCGTVKGIINRNLRWWMEKDIFDRDGILNVGYCYGNLTMAERYNSPGSPYWALKVFLLLALPDNHPYWSEEELPLPKQKSLTCLSQVRMLIQHRGRDVCAYSSAVYNKNVLGHFVEKYGKFVYSTRFGFSVAHSCENLSEAAPDSMLAFVMEESRQVYVRRRSIHYRIETDYIWSEWSPIEGILVQTEIRPVKNGHIRIHKIHSNRICCAYDCGFAVPVYEPDYENQSSRIPVFVEVKTGRKWCKVSLLQGEGEPEMIAAVPNTNLLNTNTVIPAIKIRINPGETVIQTLIETGDNRLDENS